MLINREIDISKLLKKNKAIILYGARQVGKTTLVNNYLNKIDNMKIRKFSGEDLVFNSNFSSMTYQELIEEFSATQILFIDEAQQIKNLGSQIKIILDNIENIFVILTGSSAIGLSQIGEPLVGRSYINKLYPISIKELIDNDFDFTFSKQIENALIYGLYPDVLKEKNINMKKEYLINIVNSYLLKDVLSFNKIKNSETIYNLLKLVAYQIGKPISYSELGQQLLIDVKTVKRYLDLLEKSFILFSLSPYSNNLRNVLKKKKKYYFYDLGIRNAVINSFESIDLRNDKGGIFENFVIMEKIKNDSYSKEFNNYYYFQDKNKKEIDLILEKDSKLDLFEFKYKNKSDYKKSILGDVKIITLDNFIKKFLNIK